jgi:hypothetical protein
MKKILSIFAAFIILAFNVPLAFALSNEKGSDPTGYSQRFVIENAPWFDPTACNTGGGTPTATSGGGSNGGKVYVIGDSITANTQYVQPKLKPALQALGYNDIAINSTSGDNVTQGFNKFQSDSAWQNANTIIIELGSNGGINSANIAKFTDLIKQKNPNAKIYWVNLGSVSSAKNLTPSAAMDASKVIQDNASKGYTVIDWNTVATQHPEYIVADGVGVHPFNDAGSKAYAETIAAGLNKIANTAAIGGCECSVNGAIGAINLTGNGNAEKVWNYMLSAGYSPEQVAGVLGNMEAESGVNPRRVQGTPTPSGDRDNPPSGDIGYGIVQWTPGSKLYPYSRYTNKPVNDLGFQLQMLTAQLAGDKNTQAAEKAAGDSLKKQGSIESATISFLQEYERARNTGTDAQQKRIGFAKKYYQQFKGLAPGGSVVSSPTSNGCGEAVGSGTRASIVSIAQQEVGTKGGDKYILGNDKSIPWCASFLSWVLKQAGVPMSGGSGDGGYFIPSVDGVQAYFESIKQFHPARSGYIPQPGDVVIYNEDKMPYKSHVNIVASVNGESINTIGGNESNSVKTNTQKNYNADYITGFGTPKGLK